MAVGGDDLERRLADAFGRDPGEGLGGSDMHALVAEICAAENWDDLVAVRDELRRRAGSGKEAAQYQPGPHGQWQLTFSTPTQRYAFGVTVFTDALRRRASAAVALEAVKARVSDREVLDIAERFTWQELAPHVKAGNLRRFLARERVARGEDLRDAGIAVADGDPPMYLESWEPRSYWNPPSSVVWPEKTATHDSLPAPGVDLGRDLVVACLDRIASDLEERGSVKVRGNVLEAIAALGFSAADVGEMSLAVMLAHVSYGASSRRGTRRLTDTGRRFAWTLLSAVAEATQGAVGASKSEALQRAGEQVRWISFYAIAEDEEVDEDYDDTQRQFLAIEDPVSGTSWAMAAHGPPWW